MTEFQKTMSELNEKVRNERKTLAKDKGDVKVGDVTVAQVLGGMRGVPALVCDTSTVVPDEGLRIRNIPVLELTKHYPEDVFYLLCTGSFPEGDAQQEIRAMFASKSEVPGYVWDVLAAMPKDSHPMAMLNTAVLVMEHESEFRKAYDAGTSKDQLWIPMLEDSITLLSRMTTVAAGIYRMRFNKGERIAPKEGLDWSGNFAYMLGLSEDGTGEFADLIRTYLVLHSDHGAGNVSAMTASTVGSALSDVYYSLSAGLNGLAGPLHGLANQECLKFVMDIRDKFDGVPTDEELTQFLWDHLNSGQVVPGYGHAVLRVTDPRFTAFYDFGKQYCPDDVSFKIVEALFRIVPQVLTEQGKAKNVWPNVDAASGALLYHYGMTEYDFYTVMFGVSRALGICAQAILNRAALSPIIRPKGMTFNSLKKATEQNG